MEQLPSLRHRRDAAADADRRCRRQVRPDVRAHLARLRHHLISQHRHRRLPRHRRVDQHLVSSQPAAPLR